MSNQVTNDKTNSGLVQWVSYFDVGEHTIKVTGSNFSGREWIYLDGQLVSSKFNWTFKSAHSVSINNREYMVTIELLSFLKPQIRVKLFNGDQLVDEDYICSKDIKSSTSGTVRFVASIISFFIAGFLSYYLVRWLIGV